MDEQWYERSGEADSGWYDPAPVNNAPAAPEIQKKKKRTWLVVLLVLLASVALIAGTAVIFAARSSEEGFSSVEPGIGSDFAEDFREFFENYYVAQEAVEECIIPTVERFPAIALTLRPAGTRELTLHEVYEKCVPSVVAITAYIEPDDDDSYYWGTGIVLTEDGYIVTNSHVIEGSCRAKVTLWNDEEYEVLLVGYDSRSDIAVLKIDARGLTPAEFCDGDGLVVGDRVVAIGNPLGAEFRSTMTEGIISGIDRDISYNGTTLTLLQTSTPINEGNSGGPLINMYGQVIGITNMKMSNRGSGVTIEGVGFAIPSKTVKSMADSILTSGKVLGRPALGLTLGPIPASAREEYDLPQGLYVSAVAEGSDCAAKGILPGDVLLSVDGEAVRTTSDVTGRIAELQVGDTMELRLWRRRGCAAESEYTVTVALVDVNDVY